LDVLETASHTIAPIVSGEACIIDVYALERTFEAKMPTTTDNYEVVPIDFIEWEVQHGRLWVLGKKQGHLV
jgi:hypothetical protein